MSEEASTQLRNAVARRVESEAALEHARADERRVVRVVHLGGASVREIARVIGLSHQRVQQMIEASDDGRGWKRRHKQSKALVCSFCGLDASAVQKLIAGPGVYICEHCVSRARRGFQLHDRCSFCGKSATRDLPVRGTKEVAVCRECLALCNDILAEEGIAVARDAP